MRKYKRNKLGMFVKKKYPTLLCKVCNKSFTVIPSRKDTAKFCSHECSEIYHSGKNHHQYRKSPNKITKDKISKTLTGKYCGEKGGGWTGGIRKHTCGYILIYMPEHPNAMNKAVFEHRLVIEMMLGRYLTNEETVHHINEIKTDNRIKNLYLFPTSSKHTSYHQNLKNNKPITKSNII